MTDSETRLLTSRINALSSPLQPQPTGVEPRLPQLTNIRALVFDIYGTLMISASGDIGLGGDRNQVSAFTEALEATGIDGLDAPQLGQGPELLKTIIKQHHQARRAEGIEFPEVNILDVWRQLAERLKLTADSTQLKRLAIEYECRVNPVWPMPGLADLLAHLNNSDMQLGIISNAQFYTPLLFEALLGHDLSELGFTTAFSTWSYQMLEAKPSKNLYSTTLESLAKAGIEPAQVLYIGNDQRNDIWPAAVTGCRTALFAGDQRSLRLRQDDKRCNNIQADAVITRLEQIPRLIV